MENITIKDIARICGVGVSTVSRAMNGYSGINEATKERILKTIEEYHYVPNNSARNLKMLESDTIAILVKGTSNQFLHSMVGMYENELTSRGYSFFIHTVSENQDEAEVALQLAKEKRLIGVVFLGGLVQYSKKALESLMIPYVRCTGVNNKPNSRKKITTVTIDEEKESYKAVDYLCKKGHKKIAVISDSTPGDTLGMIRQTGYEKALKDNNISVNPKLIRYMKHDKEMYSIENGYAVTKELLESGEKFTALYAISDLLAFGAYKAIKDAGKKIPDDISVMGFDGLSMTEYYSPSLTTVVQPCEEMVRASIQLLADAIKGDKSKSEILFDTSIIERDSVRDIS